jgi:hypothetical protein
MVCSDSESVLHFSMNNTATSSLSMVLKKKKDEGKAD